MGRMRMLPPSFASLSPKYRTPATGILFTTSLCLIAPWFGRAALSWVVDMTSVGITVAYFYTCYCAMEIGRKGRVNGMQSSRVPSRGLFLIGVAGCVLAVCFLLILLVPGSPGALTMPSLTALGCWLVLGVLFYILRRRTYLSHSSRELESAVFSASH